MEKTLPHVDFIIMFMSDSLMGSVLSSYVYSQLNKQNVPSKKTFQVIYELGPFFYIGCINAFRFLLHTPFRFKAFGVCSFLIRHGYKMST